MMHWQRLRPRARRWVTRLCAALLCVLACCAVVDPAAAQDDVRIEWQSTGVGNVIRPTDWAPVRLKLTNLGGTWRKVVVEVEAPDIDGDIVRFQRGQQGEITLNPAGEYEIARPVWVHVMPPAGTQPNSEWRIRVLDLDTRATLATTRISNFNVMERTQRAVGIAGLPIRGLGPYRNEADPSRHEVTRFITGLKLGELPDRWYGLGMLESLVWTEGDSSNRPDRVDSQSPVWQALREWVRRGGHLIISMPFDDNAWLASPLADMLPVSEVSRVKHLQDQPVPLWLGSPSKTDAVLRIDYSVYEPDDDAEVLLRDQAGRPTVIAKPYGFGRVTMCGVSLVDRTLAKANLPNQKTLWNAIFSWHGPWHTESFVSNMVESEQFVPAYMRDERELTRFIARKIVMTRQAATTLLLAIVVFAAYYLVAGPISFAVLKGRKQLHYSWLVFTAVVLVFTGVTWGGALLLRPQQSSIKHFTVLDFDGRDNLVRAHSWLGLFVSAHGEVEVAIDPSREGVRRDTLVSAGLIADGSGADFPDTRRYVVDGGSPYRAAVPMRSTAKQFEIDYMTALQPGSRGLLDERYAAPNGQVKVEEGVLDAALKHNLPVTLSNITFVYCPGNGQTPWAWRDISSRWEPGRLLLQRAIVANRERSNARVQLAWPLSSGAPVTGKRVQGVLTPFLAQTMSKPGGGIADPFTNVDDAAFGSSSTDIVYAMDLLSFYGAMPPPDYARTANIAAGKYMRMFKRRIARQLDLTPLIATRCLIVIGHAPGAQLPVPLRVDGDRIASKSGSHLVVRAILPVDPSAP